MIDEYIAIISFFNDERFHEFFFKWYIYGNKKYIKVMFELKLTDIEFFDGYDIELEIWFLSLRFNVTFVICNFFYFC